MFKRLRLFVNIFVIKKIENKNRKLYNVNFWDRMC